MKSKQVGIVVGFPQVFHRHMPWSYAEKNNREVFLGDRDRWFGQIGTWEKAANAWRCGNRVVVDFEMWGPE